MAPIIDLTHSLQDRAEAYPGDPGLTMAPVHQHSGNGYRVTLVTTGSHIGTHIDAPFHVLPDGRTSTSWSWTTSSVPRPSSTLPTPPEAG